MLILSRKIGESIYIGDEVIVRVMEIRGNQIRIGIDCDRNIPVHREEVYKQIQKENNHDR